MKRTLNNYSTIIVESAKVWLSFSVVSDPTSVIKCETIRNDFIDEMGPFNISKERITNMLTLAVKELFPDVTIRRLGPRKQSRSHYVGIAWASVPVAGTVSPGMISPTLSAEDIRRHDLELRNTNGGPGKMNL